MQFPAELADITDSERAHRLPRDADLAAPEPWERVVAEIRIGQSTQEFSGTRSAHHEHAAILGDILDPDRFAGRHTLSQEILIAQFGGSSRQGIELIVVQASDRHLTLNASARRQEMHERNTAYFARHLVGANAIQKSLGS